MAPAPTISAVTATLMLLPFCPVDPELWFMQVEAQFACRHITLQWTKFRMTLLEHSSSGGQLPQSSASSSSYLQQQTLEIASLHNSSVQRSNSLGITQGLRMGHSSRSSTAIKREDGLSLHPRLYQPRQTCGDG